MPPRLRVLDRLLLPQTYSSLAEGAHSFEVRAVDNAGNVDGAPAEFGWTVDTDAPDTAITLHPQSLSDSDEASFEFSGSDPGGSGVASYECRRDGGSWTGCSSPQTYSSLAEGAHSFEVRADGQRGQRRRRPGRVRLDGRHRRSATPDRLALPGPAEGGGEQRSSNGTPTRTAPLGCAPAEPTANRAASSTPPPTAARPLRTPPKSKPPISQRAPTPCASA